MCRPTAVIEKAKSMQRVKAFLKQKMKAHQLIFDKENEQLRARGQFFAKRQQAQRRSDTEGLRLEKEKIEKAFEFLEKKVIQARRSMHRFYEKALVEVKSVWRSILEELRIKKGALMVVRSQFILAHGSVVKDVTEEAIFLLDKRLDGTQLVQKLEKESQDA
jgi:Skp family chaperone for outer membrane proteins